MLQELPDRKISIVGTDIDDEAVGKFLVDRFYKVPHGRSEEYIPTMLSIVEKELPDVLLPESSDEIKQLSEHKQKFREYGAEILVSDSDVSKLTDNKYRMYEYLSQNAQISLPEFYIARSHRDFHKAAAKLGYPEKPIVIKPPVGKGSRGVRIIDSEINQKNLILKEKPDTLYMSIEEFDHVFTTGEFPELLVMEYLNGEEVTADSICLQGKELLTTFKTVEKARCGVITRGELVERPNLMKATREILNAIPLSYCINVQFIDGKLVEINPRVSTFIFQRDFLLVDLAIRLAMGEITEEVISNYQYNIDYGRRMVRYMDQVFHNDGRRVL